MTINSNLISLITLYKKEVIRFIKVYNQTLIAPAITSLIYLAIFTLAMGHEIKEINGVPFMEFMASGLIIMTVVQNAFANTSSMLVMGKVMGTIIDYLMPPFPPSGVITALTLAGVTRGIIVGALVAALLLFFVDLHVYNWGAVCFYIISSSIMLSSLGILTGIFAETFDQMSAITSYIITPFSFLSGTFYSVKNLPSFWYKISHFNPFFYMIDGFRYGITGYNDGSIQTGIIVITISTIVIFSLNCIAFKKGWRIKS